MLVYEALRISRFREPVFGIVCKVSLQVSLANKPSKPSSVSGASKPSSVSGASKPSSVSGASK